MKIYIAHSSAFDYQKELYNPILRSDLVDNHHIIFPHIDSSAPIFDSKPIIRDSDFFIAEVSYPSTGMGIEMGWAIAHDVPVLALHRYDIKPSSSIKMVTDDLLTYDTPTDMIQKITDYISIKNKSQIGEA